jgi:hypothetical protein
MFLFTISGNATYALSIVAASVDLKYLITNASWLAGKRFRSERRDLNFVDNGLHVH